MAKIIDGKYLAEEILTRVKSETARLQQHGRQPGLAVILVGADPASVLYVASKSRKASACGFHSRTIRLEDTVSQDEILEQIRQLNADEAVHGLLVQLPLPKHIDTQTIVQAIAPEKDVDGLTYSNAGRLASGGSGGFTPCTPAGIMYIVRHIHGDDLSGLDAVIVGRSNIVGKPTAALLLAANATTTIAHSRTRDLPEVIRSADILVAAAGQAEMIKGSWIKPGATIIDVGINRIPASRHSGEKTRLAGDVEFDTASIIAGHITPVPGGVGPMTIAMLMANNLTAAYRAAGADVPELS
ncbi:MAG: bifunctional methylenetetrahydrofolate dehydrogenase/methenyltetrahydrofolate cyclohydrolase [Candidatus Tokpelaia sp.]|uniref:bifunctional methylenetetrahydrofolate dehydrogenase/methenyltetrahydrofolate cyclohydrolase FolD n=1 Tax=Candidatus Tokpelaia sp. TaxID=2233777 RepID=UPI00123C0698|nr:bifunctional methylenetetrahydrofolate dehydrogenase/methenyltetrahydrofolate cyclohydrolase FolD [Candidatus Tokpelaia sp.]KAA6205631.1 MAG: bifunctional methylenetetrahydrofolate dehydrogenase/methenyltetrahydrofolate cyclohydrolase [Candidatus Tokpelaia sp.]KAA6206301.1 MAG: bifunctional methylenetetrahydrofolate dehydrogenase/methenyltetrahydrofolate cyclohydrolase [Candidatus Tokpelaia sp.]KAA6406265.1 bifunctional methylenetetrahydrofolate dehydrogenase/methenyltetrahydrofolate cyclohyd